VHVNMEYNNGDINAALASGNRDALLVVGQMFKVGASQSSSMDAIAAGIAGGDVAKARSIVATDLMDTSDGYYTYRGSLTTPTCNPVVTWVVLASAIEVTEVCLRALLVHVRIGNPSRPHRMPNRRDCMGTWTDEALELVRLSGYAQRLYEDQQGRAPGV
jgi:carbonic anhydrase